MRDELNRRDFARAAAAGLVGLPAVARSLAAAEPAEKKEAVWPLYAFGNGLGTVRTIEDKCKLLADLGYAGIEHNLGGDLAKMIECLDKHGLVLNAVYTVPMLEDFVPASWAESIKQMKCRPTRIEMGIRSKQFKASATEGDEKAAELMKAVSDLCADTGPVVSVYPHTGFWTERVDDGIRLAKLIGRKNVGTNFNLVHWYWVKEPRPVEVVLKEAAPYLKTVTINNGTKAGRKIASLDEGDYDLVGVMTAVKQIGYTGMVGLQGYSVPGPSEVHLKRSMDAWKKLRKELGV